MINHSSSASDAQSGAPLATLSTLHNQLQLNACQQELLAWLESLSPQESLRYQVVR